MDWQDYTVWAVMAAVALFVVNRLRCLVRGRSWGGCASCDAAQCPLRKAHRAKR